MNFYEAYCYCPSCKRQSDLKSVVTLPRGGAVLVEQVEVVVGEQLAAVDAGLDGAEAAQDSDLLHVAHDGRDLEALQLRVDGVEAAHEVLRTALRHLTIIHRKGTGMAGASISTPVHFKSVFLPIKL